VGTRVDIVRDVLDAQLIDAGGRPLGKVDGIAVEIEEGRPPRLLYLEVSGITLARRVHHRLGVWAEWLARRFSPSGGISLRIPWSRIAKLGGNIQVQVHAETSTAWAWERWLRDRVIGRIPGA
jgi:sporulation protein YlmC with PRC-barrel domain